MKTMDLCGKTYISCISDPKGTAFRGIHFCFRKKDFSETPYWRELEGVIEEIWSYLDILQTNRQTDTLTEIFLKSLLGLKIYFSFTMSSEFSFKCLNTVSWKEPMKAFLFGPLIQKPLKAFLFGYWYGYISFSNQIYCFFQVLTT